MTQGAAPTKGTAGRPAGAHAAADDGDARSRLLLVAAVTVSVGAWASAFVVIRGVRDSFEPGSLALGRLAIGSAALATALAVVAARGRWVRPTAAEWARIAAIGVGWFAAYNVLLNAGEDYVDAGTAAMLVNLAPVLIALLAGAFLGEGFPKWLLVGAAVAFAGAALIAVGSSNGERSDPYGVLLCVLAAVAWAGSIVVQKPVLRRIPALQCTALACAVGTVACLPFAGSLADDVSAAEAPALAGLLFLGLVPTALAFLTWMYALSRMTAGRLSVTTYLVPPLTVLIAWSLLDETPPALALVGGAVALAGVAITRRK